MSFICAFCRLKLLEGFENIDHLYTLCNKCWKSFEDSRSSLRFKRVSLLRATISKDSTQISHTLSRHLQGLSLQQITASDLVEHYFRGLLFTKFTSSFSTTNQSSDSTSNEQIDSTSSEPVLIPAQTIMGRIETHSQQIADSLLPLKDKMIESKEIITKGMYHLQSQIRNLRSEMPNLAKTPLKNIFSKKLFGWK